MRKILGIVLLCCAFAAMSGCIYRVTIPQGNLVKQEDLDQAEVGMTQTQIRFLLGTPMIDDPFSRKRWDYAYYVVVGRNDATHKRWVTIYFEDGIVSQINKDQELSSDL